MRRAPREKRGARREANKQLMEDELKGYIDRPRRIHFLGRKIHAARRVDRRRRLLRRVRAPDVASHRALPQRGPAIGNQAALRRLDRAARQPPILQRKLEVGAVNDPLEHEADAVAERVMRMADPGPIAAAGPRQVSRKCATCEAKDMEKVQRAPIAPR